eukprot:TRINITY_DN4403_c0_g2_i1.p1 TRINITY_DN4403_c0_g2~~TRINITY_DN4403_c0_g2_i1.p1  ORF type:complete len:358 (+),score=70.93 TRINITY_DN4403_c0_g2_i1:1183-2256(+)
MFDFVSRRTCLEAMTKGIAMYQKIMDSAKLPVSQDDLSKLHIRAFEEASIEYGRYAVGVKFEEVQGEISDRIRPITAQNSRDPPPSTCLYATYWSSNLKESEKLCKQLRDSVLVGALSLDNLKSMEDYEKDLERRTILYHEKAVGPKIDEVYGEWISMREHKDREALMTSLRINEVERQIQNEKQALLVEQSKRVELEKKHKESLLLAEEHRKQAEIRIQQIAAKFEAEKEQWQRDQQQRLDALKSELSKQNDIKIREMEESFNRRERDLRQEINCLNSRQNQGPDLASLFALMSLQNQQSPQCQMMPPNVMFLDSGNYGSSRSSPARSDPSGGKRFYKGGQFVPGGGRAPKGGAYY